MSDVLDQFKYHMEFDADVRYDWQIRYVEHQTEQLYLIEYIHNKLESEMMELMAESVVMLADKYERNIITDIIRRSEHTEPAFRIIRPLVPRAIETYNKIQILFNTDTQVFDIIGEDHV